MRFGLFRTPTCASVCFARRLLSVQYFSRGGRPLGGFSEGNSRWKQTHPTWHVPSLQASAENAGSTVTIDLSFQYRLIPTKARRMEWNGMEWNGMEWNALHPDPRRGG